MSWHRTKRKPQGGVLPPRIDPDRPRPEPVSLSVEQMAATEWLLDNQEPGKILTLGGYAGTGKTTVLSFLSQKLPRYAVCAFTGKAADVARRKGMASATIHSTIYQAKQKHGQVVFALKSRHELGADGFLIDEASMVGREILDDVLSFGLPIIAIGDHGQLPPVGEDAGLMQNPDVRLETIHRNAGPIARFAEHMRKGGRAQEWSTEPGVGVIPKSQATDERLLKADQTICAFNRTRVGLNKTSRRLLGRDVRMNFPTVGDRIMCMRNDRQTGVFNGQQGEVLEIEGDGTLLFKPTYGKEVAVHFHPHGWNSEKTPKSEGRNRPGFQIPFDFCYAITAHKSQGDEWGKVIVYEERCDKLWDHARWAYTAASRAKEALVWYTDK